MKILYVCYSFPPNNKISAQRALANVKYLSRLGHKLDVICAMPNMKYYDEKMLDEVKKLEDVNIFRVSSFSLGGSVKKAPFYAKTFSRGFVWVLRSFLFFIQNLRCEKYDMIYSTFGPAHPHLLAHLISKFYRAPWVAEYRDLWSNNYYYEHGYNALQRIVMPKIEKFVVKPAEHMIAISLYRKELLQSLHRKPIDVVHNGYEHDITLTPVRFSKFTVSYTGVVYKSSDEPFFQALQQMHENNDITPETFQFVYCGASENHIFETARKYGVSAYVKSFGYVTYIEAANIQAGSDVLLLLGKNDPEWRGVLFGKFYEYLRAARPILFVGYPASETTRILIDTNSGLNCSEVNEIIFCLKKLMSKEYGFTYEGVHEYSRESQVRKLEQVLIKVVKQNAKMQV